MRSIHTFLLGVIPFILVLVVGSFLHGYAAQDPTFSFSGLWIGEVGGMSAPILFTLALEEDPGGAWNGTYTYSTPNMSMLTGPTQKITLDGNRLMVSASFGPNSFSFSGDLDNDGKIAGSLAFGSTRLGMTLSRDDSSVPLPAIDPNERSAPDGGTPMFIAAMGDLYRSLGERRVRADDVSGSFEGRPLIVPPIHPAIGYDMDGGDNRITDLNRRLDSGETKLDFDPIRGYLPSLLDVLDVPVESQMLVFSRTSLQRAFIGPDHPRAIYFTDDVSVAWIPGAPLLEIATLDPTQGMLFYTLGQRPTEEPRLRARDVCLSCHESRSALSVPGMLSRSVFPSSNGEAEFQLGQYSPDHRTSFDHRWGGWYVTGNRIPMVHMGNAVVSDFENPQSMVTPESRGQASADPVFDTNRYLTPFSDVVSLLVFDHQTRMTNLLTRFGWEIRFALYQEEMFEGDASAALTRQLLEDGAAELVDYLLFRDETRLPGPLEGSSRFSEIFVGSGPYDSKNRSLREFDLKTRLMKYRCSYMIYSRAFDGLPDQAKEAVYGRMWAILSSSEGADDDRRIPAEERHAIVEILKDTKPDLPAYFEPGQIQ